MTALVAFPPAVAAPRDEVPSLPPWVGTVADLPGKVSIARVRGQREPGVVRHLLSRRIGFYFPQQLVIRRYDGRRKEYHRAFMAGFLFIANGAEGREAVQQYGQMYSDRFYGFVGLLEADASQKQLRYELMAVQGMLGVDPTLAGHDGLAKGMRVRVIKGPFRNVDVVGYIEDADATHCTFTIRLPLLGQSVAVEDMPREYLEPAE